MKSCRRMRENLYKRILSSFSGLNVEDIKRARKMAWLFPFDPEDPLHQKNINRIEREIENLRKIKTELTGGKGMIKPVSTPDGDKYL